MINMQTTVDLFCIMEQIIEAQLTSEQLDNLITQLIDYKADVDKESSDNYLEEQQHKLDTINS